MTMHNLGEVRSALVAGELDETLARLTCGDPTPGRQRVSQLLDGFQRTFGGGEDSPVVLCSAPGRTEICGNHTDHQHGRVLAAAVNLDFSACAAPNGTNTIRFQSEGWPLVEVELDTLDPKEEEKESTAALVRGMVAQAARRGYPVAGFDAYALSDVLPGSGLSSSAACEVLLGVIENHLFCRDELTPVEIAQMGQKAENLYFGKQSGLMDQTASSVGGAVAIDFADPSDPVVRSVAVDLNDLGYALCIVDSGASHAALTGEYDSIPKEMRAVAAFFGKNVLREVDEAQVLSHQPQLRKAAGDRAVLRALHFFADDRRAEQEADALERGDMDAFLAPGGAVGPLLLGAAPGYHPHRGGPGAGHGRGSDGGRAGPEWPGRLPGAWRRLRRHHPGLCPPGLAGVLQIPGGERAGRGQLPRAEHPPRGRHRPLGLIFDPNGR